MYRLITLSDEGPAGGPGPGGLHIPPAPFYAPFTISGIPPKCRTFGPALRAYSESGDHIYSNLLIDTVYEMLYEIPVCRPDLFQLKDKINTGVEACLAAGQAVEHWGHFIFEPDYNPNPLPPVRTRRGPVPAQGPDPSVAGSGPRYRKPGVRMIRCIGVLPGPGNTEDAQCANDFSGVPGRDFYCHVCKAAGRDIPV